MHSGQHFPSKWINSSPYRSKGCRETYQINIPGSSAKFRNSWISWLEWKILSVLLCLGPGLIESSPHSASPLHPCTIFLQKVCSVQSLVIPKTFFFPVLVKFPTQDQELMWIARMAKVNVKMLMLSLRKLWTSEKDQVFFDI